jgi:hypothetical protein
MGRIGLQLHTVTVALVLNRPEVLTKLTVHMEVNVVLNPILYHIRKRVISADASLYLSYNSIVVLLRITFLHGPFIQLTSL